MGGVMPLTRDAKVQAIKGVPLFSRCPKKELAEVAKLADEIDFGPGEGAHPRRSARPGVLRPHRRGGGGAAQGPQSADAQASDFFGEIALIARTPRTATVTTTADSRLLAITAHAFRTMLN